MLASPRQEWAHGNEAAPGQGRWPSRSWPCSTCSSSAWYRYVFATLAWPPQSACLTTHPLPLPPPINHAITSHTQAALHAPVDDHHDADAEPALSLDTMTMEQFEALDALFNGTRKRELAEMTEKELEEELRGLMQAMRPAKGPPMPKLDLTNFNQLHEQLAQLFDPTGERARAMEASGKRRSSRSRRLTYIGTINT